MAADRARAVRIGGAQREFHSGGDVFGGPARGAIFCNGFQRVVEGAGRVGRAPPDVALVEVCMGVDEQRRHYASRERQLRRRPKIGGARGRDFGDGAVGDQNVDPREAVAIQRGRACGKP